jgi:hypothetical protein
MLGVEMVSLVVALVCLAVVVIAIVVSRPHPPAFAPSKDVPGVRSALIFERLAGGVLEDGESAPDPDLLDAIAHALERAGAEPGPWRSDREGTVELAGLMLGDAFLLTLGSVSPVRWQLMVYAQPLGGARYAAPPKTESMKAVLRTIDRAVRELPDVHVVGWQTRQDSFHGDLVFAETPTDS